MGKGKRVSNPDYPKLLVYTGMFLWENNSIDKILAEDLIGGNTGNLLFAWSTIKLFSDVPEENFTKVYASLETELDDMEFDYFLLPLANTFRENNDKELIFLINLLKKVKAHVILNGIGGQFGKVGFHEFSNEILIREFIELVMKKTNTIGVRDERTRQYIMDFLGYSEAKVEVIGCPSVRILGRQLEKKEYLPFKNDFKIALNFTPGSYTRKWAKLADEIFREKKNSYAILQDLDEGEMISGGVDLSGVKRHDLLPTFVEHPVIQEKRYRFFTNPFDWIADMKNFQFSIGTRIHGNIAAILAGIPAMVIAIDSRTAGLAESHHIPYIWFDELREDTRIEELYYRACAEMPKFYEHFDESYDKYLEFLNKNKKG